MYEHIDFEMVENRILERISENKDIDVREGSVSQTMAAPAAVEIALLYEALDMVLRECNPRTASLEYLIEICAEKGIKIKEASKAIVSGAFVPENADVIGKRFSCGDVMFRVTDETAVGIYELECEIAGTIGNISSGTLVPVDFINGLQSAEIQSIVSFGVEEEDVEELRKRYFDIVDAQAFGGNVMDYRIKVNSLRGVGGCRIYPVWAGGGTVKVVIISGDYIKPSDDIVSAVKEELDPSDHEGEGLGIAPIGHTVTVEPASEAAVDITLNITFMDGYGFESAIDSIKETIEEYFHELRAEWDEAVPVVRISQIESRLLELPEILDLRDTLINGKAANLMLGDIEIPVIGEVINGQAVN